MNMLAHHLAPNAPETTVKKRTVYYYATQADLEKAKALAAREREARNVAYTRDATTFHAVDTEPCDEVVIMPDVSDHHRKPLEVAYQGRINGDVDFDAIGLHTPPLLEPARMVEGSTSTPPTADQGPVDLSLMTKKELREHATRRGISIDPKIQRREELIAKIQSAGA